jgi:hypothetical protein
MHGQAEAPSMAKAPSLITEAHMRRAVHFQRTATNIAISVDRLSCLQQVCGLDPDQELPMHISDVVMECAHQCARLSRECRDKEIGLALFEISARLFSAAMREAELSVGDAQAASKPALHVGPQSHLTAVTCRK